jgi:hypothetical protein
MHRKDYLKKTNHKAQRSGLHSRSKFTNSTEFNPYDSDMDGKYFNKYWDEFNSESNELIIKVENLHSDFLMPVTADEIRIRLNLVPKDFLQGLKGVIILGGSNKQLKVSWGNLFCFGAYGYQIIFLSPFPKAQLIEYSTSLPAPHIKKEAERAGAIYEFKDGLWHRIFTEESLKRFYLNDVLMHELGHHVDQHTTTDKKAERYAEWFATEYGYRNKFLEY